MKTVSIKKAALLGAAGLFAITASPALAQSAGSGVTVSVSTDYVTEYVFRGVSFEQESIQPGIEFGLGNFAIGAWASAGLGSESLAGTDEIDFYAGYSIPVSDLMSVSVGATWYHFPGATDSYEGYVSLGFDTAFAPAITAYYDVELDTFTLEGSAGYSMPMSDVTSLDFGLTGGIVEPDAGQGYQWATGSAALSYAFNDVGSVYVGGNISVNSEDFLDFGDGLDESTLFWFGTGVSAGF